MRASSASPDARPATVAMAATIDRSLRELDVCTRSDRGRGAAALQVLCSFARPESPLGDSGLAHYSVEAADAVEQRADDHVDEPDHDRGADVRPEPVDREAGRNPLGEREHRDVDREVEEAEGEDDERKREDRENRLDDGVADHEHERAHEQRAPATDVHAVEDPVHDHERENVDSPQDEQADEPGHGASLTRPNGKRAQNSFWSFMAAPMSPLIFNFPVM